MIHLSIDSQINGENVHTITYFFNHPHSDVATKHPISLTVFIQRFKAIFSIFIYRKA